MGNKRTFRRSFAVIVLWVTILVFVFVKIDRDTDLLDSQLAVCTNGVDPSSRQTFRDDKISGGQQTIEAKADSYHSQHISRDDDELGVQQTTWGEGVDPDDSKISRDDEKLGVQEAITGTGAALGNEQISRDDESVVQQTAWGNGADLDEQINRNYDAIGFNQMTRNKRADSDTEQGLKVVMNELLFYDSSFFIEMRKIGGTVKRGRKDISALKGFQLVILDTLEPEIVFTAYLGQQAFKFEPEALYWTFGKNLANLHISDKAASETVQAVPTPEMFKFEPKRAYMFIIQQSGNMQKLQLSHLENEDGKWIGKKLRAETNLINILADTTVDLVLACFSQPCKAIDGAAATLLDTLQLKHVGNPLPKNAMIVMKKFSLNLCTTPKPFQYSQFFHGVPSPGAENDCHGSRVETADCDFVDFETLKEDEALSTFERVLDCEVNKVQTQDLLKQEVSISNPKWANVFQSWKWKGNSLETIQRCSKYFSSDGKILKETSIAPWLKLTPEGRTCQMHCSACQLFGQLQLRSDFHRLPALATIEGVEALTEPRRNDENLKRHNEAHMHRVAIVLLKAVAGKSDTREQVKTAELFEEKVYFFYQPTMRIVALAYAELKAGVSFRSHSQLVEALGRADTQVGVLHRQPRTTVLVANVLSEQFRKEMLQLFVEVNSPFSIIVDSSTDVSNSALVACVVQVHANGMMKTFFYGILKVSRENAEQMSKVIVDQVKSDNQVVEGFEEIFRSKLAAVVSDNANVMVGERKSVFVQLKQYTGRAIVSQPCYNHKLQIVFKKALKMGLDEEEVTYQDSYTYFQALYKMNNMFYVFFNSRGSKRYGALRAVCVETSVSCYRYKSYLDIRWAASHFEVSKAIAANWIPCIEALKRLRTNSDETAKTRAKISELEGLVTGTFYILSLHEQLDILSVFKKSSLLFQQKNIPMIDLASVIEETVESLLVLKSEAGPHLQSLLDNCTCNTVCAIKECNLNNVDDCLTLKCNGVPLKSSSFKLVPLKPIVIDSLVMSLYTEFPIDLLRSFKVLDVNAYKFDPFSSPQTIALPADFKANFAVVCTYLGYNPQSIRNLESLYIVFLKEHGKNLQNKQLNGISKNVNQAQDLAHDPALKEFFLKLLSIPIGSAEAERVFSYMTMYKSQYRSLMSVEVLNNLITVKMNGPPVNQANFYNFTKLFLQKHKRSDSKYSFKKTSSAEIEENEDFLLDDNLDLEEDVFM